MLSGNIVISGKEKKNGNVIPITDTKILFSETVDFLTHQYESATGDTLHNQYNIVR